MYNIPDYEKDIKKFLDGIVETKRVAGIGIVYNTFHWLEVNVDYRYISTRNRQKEEDKLPGGKWKAGWNTRENELEISVQFRY